MKEENGKQSERIVVIDFHMDPKLISREREEERKSTEKKGGKNTGPVVALLLFLSFIC